jgi:ABC-type antimicrobial peptide transport system permease subunit
MLTRAAGIGLGGTAVGLLIFFVVLREMVAAQFSGLPAWQPLLFYRTAALLVGVGLVAAWLPAWKLVRKPPASLLG